MNDVSIALATYNGERYLAEQLASLEAQTLKPAELVVCDDQSSDASIAVVERFAATASFPVRIHRNPERLGWRGNFLKAAGLCSHDLIAFCDQDDVWYPEKLATVVSEFEDVGVLLVYHNADLCDANLQRYSTLLPISNASFRIARRTRPTIWSNPFGLTMVFRRTLTQFNSYWPASVDLSTPSQPAAHDQWFYFLATNLGEVISLPERLLAYRQHAANTVGFKQMKPSRSIVQSRTTALTELDLTINMMRAFSQILSRLSEDATRSLHRDLDAAAIKNGALTLRLERRQSLYRSTTLGERVLRFLSLCQQRVYGQATDWGLGKRALLKDALFVLFGNHTS